MDRAEVKEKSSINKDNNDSIFQRTIQRRIDKGIIKLESDGSKITYLCKKQCSISFKNPEEKEIIEDKNVMRQIIESEKNIKKGKIKELKY